MKKWALLIPNILAVTSLPFIGLTSCGCTEILPDQIQIWYGDHQTGPIELDVGETLEFFATTLPEEATKNLVFHSSNESLAKFEGNKLIPQGYNPKSSKITNITAYPVGHPEYVSKSNTIAVIITKEVDFDTVDESQVEIIKPIISSPTINTYGITLSNFKTNWEIKENPGEESYYLTSKIEWISEESIEDDAAGIINIDYDSFQNTHFDVICSFKTTQKIEVGHVFEFRLNFKIPELEKEIKGTKTYSVTYEGDDNLVINDSSVVKEVDFNHGDYKHATITGFRTNFDFGDGTNYQLKISSYDLFSGSEEMDPTYEIINKKKDGDGCTFDLSISLKYRAHNFEESTVHFYFILNNVAIYATDDYLLKLTDAIKWNADYGTTCFGIEIEDDIPKLKLTDFETNFSLSTHLSSLTAKFWTNDKKLQPVSYNIIKTTDNNFDLELIWEKDLPSFDVTPIRIEFYFGTDVLLSFFPTNFKFTTDNIKFVGDTDLRLNFDTDLNKYFVKITYFQGNFQIDKNLISIENLSFTPEITQPETSIKAIDEINFDLYLYWDIEVECSEPVNGSFDLLYDGQDMIQNFNFTFIKPSEDSYYDITVETNYGDIDVINNKKNEEIKVGIKNIDITAKELVGFYVQIINDGFYSYDYGRYEYIQQPQDEYKFIIYVDPDSESAYEPIRPTDKVVIGAIFEDKNHVINLTESSQTTLLAMNMDSFQTKQTVNLKAGTTYYVKADLASWEASKEWTTIAKYPLAFFFACGENIDDSSTFKELNQPFYCFYQKFGVSSFDYSPSAINMMALEVDELGKIQPLSTSKMVFVWTPSENMSNVHFALNAAGQYHYS